MRNLRFMVVDADDYEAMLTGAALSALGHHVDKFTSAEIAIEALGAMPYDAVVAAGLDNMTRSDFAREASRADPRVKVIFGKDAAGVAELALAA